MCERSPEEFILFSLGVNIKRLYTVWVEGEVSGGVGWGQGEI